MTHLSDRERTIQGYIAGTVLFIVVANFALIMINWVVREPFAPWLLFTGTSAFFLILSLVPIQKRLARIVVRIIDRKKNEREKIDF
jgi:hypothetical protein